MTTVRRSFAGRISGLICAVRKPPHDFLNGIAFPGSELDHIPGLGGFGYNGEQTDEGVQAAWHKASGRSS